MGDRTAGRALLLHRATGWCYRAGPLGLAYVAEREQRPAGRLPGLSARLVRTPRHHRRAALLLPRGRPEEMEGSRAGGWTLRPISSRGKAGGTRRVTHRCHHRKELKHRSWSIALRAPRYLGSPVRIQLYFLYSVLILLLSAAALSAVQTLPVAEGPRGSSR